MTARPARDPNLSITTDAVLNPPTWALSTEHRRMRDKVWTSYVRAIYDHNAARALDRLDLLFSLDHGGYDMYDEQFTTVDRDEYKAATRNTAVAEIAALWPKWTDR
jgi:hypothetical protein